MSLLKKDQLRKQKDLKHNFLTYFEEGNIEFPPTYKLGNTFLIQIFTLKPTVEIASQAGPIASSIKPALPFKD